MVFFSLAPVMILYRLKSAKFHKSLPLPTPDEKAVFCRTSIVLLSRCISGKATRTLVLSISLACHVVSSPRARRRRRRYQHDTLIDICHSSCPSCACLPMVPAPRLAPRKLPSRWFSAACFTRFSRILRPCWRSEGGRRRRQQASGTFAV